MKRHWCKLFSFLCVAVLYLVFQPPSIAQQDQHQKPEQTPQQNPYRDQTQDNYQDLQQKERQSLTGKVSEKYGKYYLETEFHKASYEMQGSWELKQFLNKKVRVTATVDSDRSILHVISITKIP